MQPLKLLTLTPALILFVSFSNAQALEEHHKKLTHHHLAIIKETEKIQDEKLTAEKTHTEDIGKHIESAQQQHAKLLNSLTPEQKTATKEHNDAIEKYHTEAAATQKAMKDELDKSYPDKVRVKKYAKKINDSITAAENEHTEMKKQTGTPE